MKLKPITKKIAGAINAGTGNTLDLIELMTGKLQPLAEVPLLGDVVLKVQDCVSMLNDYQHGRYRKLPFPAMIGGVVMVAYLLMPFDIIPDDIPILGFIDDAFIINTILNLCLDAEIERYRRWRETQGNMI